MRSCCRSRKGLTPPWHEACISGIIPLADFDQHLRIGGGDVARSFLSLAMQAARAAERADRGRQREQVRYARDLERVAREQERLDKRSYLEGRAAEVEDMNRELAERVSSIETLLADSLARSVGINWQALQRHADERDLDKVPGLTLGPRPDAKAYAPAQPGLLGRLLPGWKQRFNTKVAEGQHAFQKAFEEYSAILQARQSQFGLLEAEVQEQNRQVSSFREAYRTGNPEAVSGFFDLVFEKTEYPEGFPSKWKVVYLPESRQLIVDYDLPTLDDIVPAVEKYRYTKSTDQITETKKALKARQSLYSAAVAQSVLRRLYEVFRSDRDQLVDVATVSAFVDTIDPSTGQRVRPCVVSVRTTRDEFDKLDLRHVDALACLKRLNASVSRSPSELTAVKPIIDINMVDPRFIQESDVLSTLDSRPNLMELTPGEFENLITNLFQRMGLETKLTQASRDGGVDCVAFDPRPVLGGKVVVQAKRYKNTVGVSAVRDLFGTMHNEGASKGILVTTSGYGTAAYDFANGKPIELISGSNLLYLLKEHAGIEAKIVVPEDWHDPQMDS